MEQVTSFKLSLLQKIDLQNITTKLKWKLYTKVIKRPREGAWVWINRVFN